MCYTSLLYCVKIMKQVRRHFDRREKSPKGLHEISRCARNDEAIYRKFKKKTLQETPEVLFNNKLKIYYL